MSTRHLFSVVLLAALVLNARASFYFTWNAPGAVNVGQNYTVGVQAYFTPSYSGDPYATLGLYRNGSQVGGGGTSAYGSATASNSFTDNSPQTVGYSADVYSYYGESDYSSHSVTVNGAPANNPPTAWVTVDGQSHGTTVTRPYGGSVSVTVRYKASDPDNNLARIRPQVWHPSGYLNNNGGNFIGQSGGYGEVAWTVTLNENGNWHFWTDAEDTNNVFVNSGAWSAGFRLTVVEGAPPNTPPTVVLHSPSAQTIYLNQALTITSQATDPDNNIAHHNLDIQRPDGSWNWQGGFANGHPYTGGYNGSPGNSNRSASFTFNQLGTWYVRSAAADSSGWYHSATVAINVINAPDTTPPGAPANLQISNPTSSGFTASWTAPSGEAVTGYRVRLNSGGFTEIGNVLSRNFTGLTANTAYTVEVQARDAAGNWSGSASYGVTTGGGSNSGGGTGQALWFDTNNDGILDKVTGSNSPSFYFYIDSWTTENVAYINAPVHAWISTIGNIFSGTFYENYSRWWQPVANFSNGYSTHFRIAFRVETEADRPQKIYVDYSRLTDINRNRWQLLINLPGFATGGWHEVYHNIFDSGLFDRSQYFLVEEGKPLAGVRVRNSSGTVGSVTNNGTIAATLPVGGEVVLDPEDVAGTVGSENPQIIWDVINTATGAVIHAAEQLSTVVLAQEGIFRVSIKQGDGQAITFFIVITNPSQPTPIAFKTYLESESGSSKAHVRNVTWKPATTDPFGAEYMKTMAYIWETGSSINLIDYLVGSENAATRAYLEANVKWKIDGVEQVTHEISVGSKPSDDSYSLRRIEVLKVSDSQTQDRLLISILPQSTQTNFANWYAAESTDNGWLAGLPPMPVSLECSPALLDPDRNYDPRIYRSPSAQESHYHPLSYYEIRSKMVTGDHAHQVCFDENGTLILSGISAGTADREAAWPEQLWAPQDHLYADVKPFIWALQLDGNPSEGTTTNANLTKPILYQGAFIEKYIECRPIIPNDKPRFVPGSTPTPP